MVGDRVSLRHVRALDGLRGAAVTGVVLYHGNHLKGGYLGVDLFFVLSGFLITSLLLAEFRHRGRIALGAFWARRARRLLPALVPLLLGIAIYCIAFAAPTELGRIRLDTLATLGYVANWRAIGAHQSYFELFSAPSPLQHTWSLAIEEQFYLLWPLIFVGLAAWWKQHTPRAVLLTAIVLAAGSASLMFGLYDHANPNRAYFGTDTRSFALFAGIAVAAAVAIWGHTSLRSSRVLLEITALSGLVVLGVMWVTLDGQAPRLYRGGFAVAGIAAAVVIASAAHPQRGPIGWLFSFPPLCWLGLISYGLYLWHWPVDVVLTADRVGLSGWPLFAVRSAIAIVIAVASYVWVEMPIRRGAFRPRQWRIAIPAVTAAVLLAVVTTTAGAVDSPTSSGKLPTGPPPTSHRLLLVGDSVALSLQPGFERTHSPVGLWWSAGCRWIHGSLRFPSKFAGDCSWEYAFDYMIGYFHPDRVMTLMGTWDLFGVRRPGTSTFLTPGTPGWTTAFRAQLERGIAIAARHGVSMTLLTLPCARLSIVGAKMTDGDPGATDIRRVRAANRIIEETVAAHPGTASTIDLYGFLCPHGRFQPKLHGVTLRTDGLHFSDAGADLVARWLTRQIGLTAATTTTTTASTPTIAPPSTTTRP